MATMVAVEISDRGYRVGSGSDIGETPRHREGHRQWSRRAASLAK
jgi:hypothetical protein